MQRARRVLVLVAVMFGAMVSSVATAPTVFAATITSPTGNPFVVPGNAAGQPQPFTVSASGYASGDQVFIEQCDGVATTTPGWDPTTNCDLGSSPAAATASATGIVTFSTTDPNHVFRPFKGISPQGLFNCLGPTDPVLNNGLENFRNCKLRVSTNNSTGTSDQVFLNLQLPNSVASAPTFTGNPTAATVGAAYSYTFTGITGAPTPTFTMSPTTVAGGITVSAAGNLHGTPTAAGSFPITVTASNGTAPNAARALTLVVAPAPVSTSKIDCGLSGSLGLKPTLSNVVPKRPKANKLKGSVTFGSAAGLACVNHSVAAGTTKYPISSGSAKLKGQLPAGSSCSTLSTLPLGGTSIKIKWQGINPKNGKLSTVGRSVALVSTVTTTAPGTYKLRAPVTEGPFAGAAAELTLRTDQTHAVRLAQCNASGITSIGFTGVGGASIIAIV